MANKGWQEIKNENRLAIKIEKEEFELTNHTSEVYNGKLYVFGGNNSKNDEISNHFFEFNIEKKEWRELINEFIKPTGRINHTSNIRNGEMYIFGGMTADNKQTNELWCYSFSTNMWHEIKQSSSSSSSSSLNYDNQLPAARSNHSAVLFRNRYLVMYGGWNAINSFSDIWCFDLEKKRWFEVTSIDSNNHDHDHDHGNNNNEDAKKKRNTSVIRVKHRSVLYNDNQMIIVAGEDENAYLQNDVFVCNLLFPPNNYDDGDDDDDVMKMIYGENNKFKYSWEKLEITNNIPECFGHQLLLWDNYLFLFGGYAGDLHFINDLYFLRLNNNNNNDDDSKTLSSSSKLSWQKLKHTNRVSGCYAHSISFYFNKNEIFPSLLLFGGINSEFCKSSSVFQLILDFDFDDENSFEANLSSELWTCMMCTFQNSGNSSSCLCCGYSK